MAGSIFSRVKNWISGETLTNEDLNAEIDNILDNLDAEGSGGYSDNVTEMQVTTDPGEVGTESLATTIAGEVERLRYEIAAIKGGTGQWYTNPTTNLTEINNVLGTSVLSPQRVSSGKTTGNSSQSLLIDPDGTDDGVVINATAVDLVYFVDSVQYTLDTDIEIEFQVSAPTTNNTCLVNDTTAADQEATKHYGEFGSQISIDTIGAEISALDGQIAAFKINNGSADEYFLARVDTSNNRLVDCRRGYFFGPAGARIPRITFANNDTITLMNIDWFWLRDTGAVYNSYLAPIISATEPTSPGSSQFWFDLNTNKWKRFDGTSFSDAASVFIGLSIIDESQVCVAARSVDFAAATSSFNTMGLEFVDTETIRSQSNGAVNVFGTFLDFATDTLTWDITADLDTGLSERGGNIRYYAYIKEDGTPVLSDVKPGDFFTERNGLYHPNETWRCVGSVNNNGANNFESINMNVYGSERVAVEDRFQESSSSSTYTMTSGTVAQVTNLSLEVVCRGRPLLIALVPDGTGNPTQLGPSATGATVSVRQAVYLVRDATTLSATELRISAASSASQTSYTNAFVASIDNPGPGTYTYVVQTNVLGGTPTTANVQYCKLVVIEM